MYKYLKAALVGAGIAAGSLITGAVAAIATGGAIAVGNVVVFGSLFTAGYLSFKNHATTKQILVGIASGAMTLLGIGVGLYKLASNIDKHNHVIENTVGATFSDKKQSIHFNTASAVQKTEVLPVLKTAVQPVRTLNS